jgi:DNA-binding transcriptional MerR regulator
VRTPKTEARNVPPEAAHAAANTAEEALPGALPIGRLAHLAGVSTRTVRYYEEIGLLRTARRYAGGRRVFPVEALERLRFIGRLKRLGFSLEEISHLNEVFALNQSTAAMLRVLDGQLARHIGALDKQMETLRRMRAELVAYRGRIGHRLESLEPPEAGPTRRDTPGGAGSASEPRQGSGTPEEGAPHHTP